MERIVGGIFIEAAMPSSCSHSCRQFLTIIQAFAHTEPEKHSPPSVAKISARYTYGGGPTRRRRTWGCPLGEIGDSSKPILWENQNPLSSDHGCGRGEPQFGGVFLSSRA